MQLLAAIIPAIAEIVRISDPTVLEISSLLRIMLGSNIAVIGSLGRWKSVNFR